MSELIWSLQTISADKSDSAQPRLWQDQKKEVDEAARRKSEAEYRRFVEAFKRSQESTRGKDDEEK